MAEKDDTGQEDGDIDPARQTMLLEVAALREEYCQALPGMIEQLEQLWSEILLFDGDEKDDSDPDRQGEDARRIDLFLRKAHEISGSSGLFGLFQVHQAAAELEKLASQQGKQLSIPGETRERAKELLKFLHKEKENAVIP